MRNPPTDTPPTPTHTHPHTQGGDLSDSELLDYISEATTMSKGMDEYEGR